MNNFNVKKVLLQSADDIIANDNYVNQADADGRILSIQLLDNGIVSDTTGYSLKLVFTTDKEYWYDFTPVDLTNGIYEITYPSSIQVPGDVNCEIWICKGTTITATRPFIVTIGKSVINGDAIVASDEFTTLQNMIFTVQGLETTYATRLTAAEAKVNELTTNLALKSNQADVINPINQSNVLALSESILGAGNIMPQYQGLFNPQPNVQKSIFGGSHISTALAEMCDKVYTPQNAENAIINSNNMDIAMVGGIGWDTTHGIASHTQTYLKDGTLWNKIVTTGVNPQGVWQRGLTIPTATSNAFLSFEVYIPLSSTPSGMTALWILLQNETKTTQMAYYQFNHLVPGKRYRLSILLKNSDFTVVPSANDNITLKFSMNQNASPVSYASCTAYFRNIEFAWNTSYTSYTATLGTKSSATTVAMQEDKKNSYAYKDIDTILISYGRNEANDGVDAYSHYRAYDKLLKKCSKVAQTVIAGNPPPYLNGTIYDTVNDLYVNQADNRFDSYFKKLISKWNGGVNVYQKLLDLVTAGTYTPVQLNVDSWHPSNTGGLEIAKLYSNKVNTRNINNNCDVELKNDIKYYALGIPTGTWNVEYVGEGTVWYADTFYHEIESRILYSQKMANVSSTQNDYLLFTNVEAEQLHIIFRQDATYGTFDVIIDEGLPQQRTFSINSATQAERIHGQFVCDFLNSGTHTIKIKVTSTGKLVKIHGIVAI